MALVVFGAVFVDIKGHPYERYIPGGRNRGYVEVVHGGVSRNIAHDAANLGLDSILVSAVDDSAVGAGVLLALEGAHVDTSYMRASKGGNGTWLAVMDESGDTVASVSERPDLSPIASVLDERGDELFGKADAVLLEIDMDPALLDRIFALAERHGVPVYAAVANMSEVLKNEQYIERCACFVCNRQEAGMLFGTDYAGLSPEQIRADVSSRMAASPFSLVVTLSGDGAAYFGGGGSGVCPAHKVDVVDTTGAGDSFFAGLCAALTRGKPLDEACRIATYVASRKIRLAGSVCPVMSFEETEL